MTISEKVALWARRIKPEQALNDKAWETTSRAIRYEIKLSQALFQFVGRGLGLSSKQGLENLIFSAN
jgi:hypothetical protein